MSTWLSPSDPWPPHGRADAELAYAASNGWWLVPRSDHSFGTLYCRRIGGDQRADRSEYCRFMVLSTAGGATGDTGKLIKAAVDRCGHHTAAEQQAQAPGASERLAAALRDLTTHLSKANRLCDSYEALLEAAEHRVRRDELLDMATEIRDDAISLLDAAEQAEAELSESLAKAEGLATEAGYPLDPWPPDAPVTQLLDPAEVHAEVVASLLEGHPDRAVRQAREQLNAVCERIRLLREANTA